MMYASYTTYFTMRRVQERIRIHGPEQSVDGERSSRLSKDLAAASAEDDPVWNTLCGAGGQGVSHPGGSTGRVVKPYGVIWKVSDFLSEKHPCLYWHMVKPVPKNPYVGRRIEKESRAKPERRHLCDASPPKTRYFLPRGLFVREQAKYFPSTTGDGILF